MMVAVGVRDRHQVGQSLKAHWQHETLDQSAILEPFRSLSDACSWCPFFTIMSSRPLVLLLLSFTLDKSVLGALSQLFSQSLLSSPLRPLDSITS